MKFSEEQTHKVKLHHRDVGDLGEAKLRFGGEWGVVATMGRLSAGLQLGLSRLLDFVTATTEDGQAFTLGECRIHDFSLIAAFLVYGNVTENHFLKVEVRYSDISEWFLRPERVEGNVGEQLTWTRRSEHFSADVNEGARRFRLFSGSVGSRERIGEDLIVHEHVQFSFDSCNDGFSLNEIRDKAIELCALLSLLVAYPISILTIDIHTKQGHTHSLYFGTFKPLQRENTREFSIQCFLRKVRLDGQWPLILNKYYQDQERRDLWVRLAGMRRYEGFWDFRLLGYVGLLDRYVSQRSQALPGGSSPPSLKKVNKFSTELYKLAPLLGRPAMTAISNLAKRIFGSRHSSFADRYAYAMEHTDREVRAVINLTTEDFELIKDVRDRIAHGEPPEVPDADFTKINVIIGRIALLMTYWTLHDLGLSKTEFLGSMNATHSHFFLSASVDRKSLARATGTSPFCNVSAEKFEWLASRKDLRHDSCFIEGSAGEIEFSAEYTARWRNWLASPTGGIFPAETIFEVEKAAVNHHGIVYVESDGRTLEMHSVWIFNK